MSDEPAQHQFPKDELGNSVPKDSSSLEPQAQNYTPADPESPEQDHSNLISNFSQQASLSIHSLVPVLKPLHDKLYEKRKGAALEIEKWVRDTWAQHLKETGTLSSETDSDKKKPSKRIPTLEYAYSAFPNSRNGGLIGLAAAAIALGPDVSVFLSDLMPPVLSCFSDQDSRVRYYACESMYNIAKVAKSDVLIYFNELFDALSKLTADNEVSVKNGAELLDRLIKDIVSEHPLFDVKKFIPLLQERIQALHPNTRQFLVSWIMLLDSVPEIKFVSFLPDFLGGLFQFLSDTSADIRTMTERALNDLLQELKGLEPDEINFSRLTLEILKHNLISTDESTQYIALTWINEFNSQFEEQMIPFVASLISHVLPSLAHSSEALKQLAEKTNHQVYIMTENADNNVIDFSSLVKSLVFLFQSAKESCRIASLDWLIMLHKKSPTKTFTPDDSTFPVLLKALATATDEVIKRDLRLLAQISTSFEDDALFIQFLEHILQIFRHDRRLLDSRGGLIIRQLCLSLSPVRVYSKLSGILEKEKDLDFASLMIQNLTIIMLTSSELVELRKRLADLELKENLYFFQTIYKSWCHNAVSTVALCLLAKEYEHSSLLVQSFGELEITVNLLIQVDKLVQLLESPIFTYVRLDLLEPDRNHFLYKTLYGILMILPQSSAFATLRNRLNSVHSLSLVSGSNTLTSLNSPPPSSNNKRTQASLRKAGSGDKFNDHIIHFKTLQGLHERHKANSNNINAGSSNSASSQSQGGGNINASSFNNISLKENTLK